MQLKEAQQHYSNHTTKASEASRQLCFAGIAILWILATENGSNKASLSLGMLLPLACFVFALSFDLLHYIFASFMWGCWTRKQERQDSTPEREILAPAWINWPAILLFWVKLFATIVGYYLLFIVTLEEVAIAL
tara:strand:- start:3616 stop:4017 length:402 start_codon:yes stop_codon:yes gene_type:complete